MFNFATVNVYIRFPNIVFFSNWCEYNEICLFGQMTLDSLQIEPDGT